MIEQTLNRKDKVMIQPSLLPTPTRYTGPTTRIPIYLAVPLTEAEVLRKYGDYDRVEQATSSQPCEWCGKDIFLELYGATLPREFPCPHCGSKETYLFAPKGYGFHTMYNYKAEDANFDKLERFLADKD